MVAIGVVAAVAAVVVWPVFGAVPRVMWPRTVAVTGDVTGYDPAGALVRQSGESPVVAAFGEIPCSAAISWDVTGVEQIGGGIVGLGGADGSAVIAVKGLDTAVLVDGVPDYTLAGNGGGMAARDVGGYQAAGVTLALAADGLTDFAGVDDADRTEVDPFLSLVDVWDGGPLGEMRRAANLLRRRGDEAAFGDAAAEYWRAMNAATERRAYFGGRGKRNRAAPAQ